MKPKTLSRPPVLEVVLNFGVVYGQQMPFSVERARAFADMLGGFARVQDVPAEEGDSQGIIAFSDENTRAIQVLSDTFAINLFGYNSAIETSPIYDSWESVRGHARPLWNAFCAHFEVEHVNHLALRYINELTFEPDHTGERRLLESWPSFSPELINRDPEGFVMRMEVPLRGNQLRATIVHIISHDDEGNVRLIVDNDVIKSDRRKDIEEIWEDFEAMRHVKNKLFYDALTETALKPYE